MPAERLPLQVTPEAMKLVVEALEQRALEQLGFVVRFSWPDPINWEELSLVVQPEKELSDAQHEKLWRWLKLNAGAEKLTFWDRIRRDDGV